MACNCKQRRKKRFSYVKALAIKFVKATKEDAQIYTTNLPPIGQIYDFEPINTHRKTVVEYIKFENL